MGKDNQAGKCEAKVVVEMTSFLAEGPVQKVLFQNIQRAVDDSKDDIDK